MKNLKLFIFVLALALCLSVSAFAEDTHFTCESDINDFNGKTFDNLYLDLVSCGENVEFTDLTVTGNLVYNGGTDTVDHYITFDKPAIQNMWIPCEPTHNVNITFIPSDDVEYVVSEMTVMPTGTEKGKIVLNGTGERTIEGDFFYQGKTYTTKVPNDFYATEIDRLNYVTGKIDDTVKTGFIHPDGMPEKLFSLNSDEINVELEINHIDIMKMSVVNTNKSIIPAMTSHDRYVIEFMAVYSPAIRLFSYNPDAWNWIVGMISAADGDNVTVSLDKTFVDLFHFFGNNNPESRLSILVGNEVLHARKELVKNLFLFGSNLDFMGYGNPNRREMDMLRVIITEQPDDYGFKPVPTILNDFLNKYITSDDLDEEEWKSHDDYRYQQITLDKDDEENWKNYNKYRYPYGNYAGILDLNAFFKSQTTKVLTDLSQQYGINYPDSNKNWSPEINLSYANIGKAVCAKEITDRIGPYQMIHIKHSSYMNTQPDVMRYVMPGELTWTLAEEPKITTQTQLDDLFEGLPDGCYVFSFDEYGRPYLVE